MSRRCRVCGRIRRLLLADAQQVEAGGDAPPRPTPSAPSSTYLPDAGSERDHTGSVCSHLCSFSARWLVKVKFYVSVSKASVQSLLPGSVLQEDRGPPVSLHEVPVSHTDSAGARAGLWLF